MSVVITKDDLIAYAEVDYILKHMNEKYISKVPQNLLTFFDTMKDPDYEVYVHPYKPLANQGLKKYALEIIALLHVKYWCEDQERKEKLIEKMRENQERFEAQLREKFSTDNIFKNPNEEENEIKEDDPIVTAFSKYTQNNPDIQDYTDVVEPSVSSNEYPETVEEKTSFFGKLKLFISKIFGKGTK